MAAWLAAHPNIYLSPIKEPNFFNTDDKYKVIRSLHEYEKLFKDTQPEHIAVGEASVWYLYSQVAVDNILKYAKSPKFIVMLRNPIDMAFSLHQQEIYSANEHITDFKKAWLLQEKRANGLEISRYCNEPRRILYGPACKLGEQLARLYRLVPKESVLTVILDDVKDNPRHEYLRVLKFLNVPDDGRTTFPVYNPAKVHRSLWLGKWLVLLRRVSKRVQVALGIQSRLGILSSIFRANTDLQKRPFLNEEMRTELALYFQEDIATLSQLLGRDFSSSWIDKELRADKGAE